ncbi:MAG: nucleoside-diphosphate-sugar pyrophosphorylase [candidate division Zixibacteria bacterium SM23_73_2]|nr:MAG: nucleoside-diphosphate-sugar pyrophosphorylase [candidate division Zixibacteria bacterium SM23_73_2]
MKVIILAGGKGKRLEPYTTVLPKPLLPVGDFPILEVVIKQLKAFGFSDIILAVGHLGNLIQSYFGNGREFGVKISYHFEQKPLGTVGALASIKNLKRTFLVLNGDILTTFDFSEFLARHKKNKNIATIAVTKREMKVDFGVCECDDFDTLKRYTEKPTLRYLVSMGIYLFEPEILKFIHKGKKLDFPQLMNILLKRGEKISVFRSADFWLDLGRPEDYIRGMEQFERIKNKIFNPKK